MNSVVLRTNTIDLFLTQTEFKLNTTMSNRIVFKTDNKEGSLYKQSPYFVGAKLWDSLTLSIIELPDISSFKKRLKEMNKVYVDVL